MTNRESYNTVPIVKNSEPDRLVQFRAKCMEEISLLEAKISSLRDKIKLLDEIQADSPKPSNGSDLDISKYSGMKLTKAVLDAVETIAVNGGVSATDVRKYVAGNGYRHPTPKNFPVATVIALSRLVKREKIESVKLDGNRRYMAKK